MDVDPFLLFLASRESECLTSYHAREGRSVVNIEFFVNGPEMVLDRSDADSEFVRDQDISHTRRD